MFYSRSADGSSANNRRNSMLLIGARRSNQPAQTAADAWFGRTSRPRSDVYKFNLFGYLKSNYRE